MNTKKTDWELVADQYEKEFGQKPRKNMKIESMRKKLDAVEPENPVITDKMSELMEVATKASSEGKPTMICLVQGDRGIHMSMSGDGQEVAIMVATAIVSEPRVGSVITNGAMMAQMRINDVANKAKLDEDGNELAPEGMPEPQTKS